MDPGFKSDDFTNYTSETIKASQNILSSFYSLWCALREQPLARWHCIRHSF
jgi:hypothetical protein